MHYYRRHHPRIRRRTQCFSACALLAAALLAAVWITPRASAGARQWLQGPPVETRTFALSQPLHAAPAHAQARLGARQTATDESTLTLDAGTAFTMLGVLCDTPADAGAVVVRLRTSADGQTWSAWYEAPLELGGEQGGDVGAFTEAVWTGPARLVQLSAQSMNGQAVELHGVRLAALDTGAGESATEQAVAVLRRATATIAGVDFAAPAAAAIARPTIVTRAQWGADESLRNADPVYASIKVAFVHHSAGGNTYTREDAPAIVRGVYAYHTQSLGWNDVGYNFLVDRFGTIYEGRYGGVTRGVVGAHVYGFNTGSTGVSVLGTYTDNAPPAAALTSLERLLAWKLELKGLNPIGTSTMTCGASEKYALGSAVTFPTIAGHRDANYTACPGEAFYAQMPAIRKATGALFPPPAVAPLTLNVPVFSPNADGVLDRAKVTATLTGAAKWSVKVSTAAGKMIRSYSGTTDVVSVIWDGKDAAGATAANGAYTVVVQATSVCGSSASRTTHVVLDTVAPRVLDLTVYRPWLSPNSDAWGETDSVTYSPSEPCDVRAFVVDAGRVTTRVLHDWTAVSTVAKRKVSWDGRVTEGGALVGAADGVYRVAIEVRDGVGNVRRSSGQAIVDRTIGAASSSPATFSPNADGVQDAAQLGFTLSRAATVTATITSEGKTIRTLSAVSLAAGARTVTWNGRADDGTLQRSGTYAFRVFATSSLGTTSAGGDVRVDRYGPRLSAPATSSVTLGQTAKIAVRPVDPYSPDVELWCVVTNAKGERVTKVSAGWVTPGVTTTVSWLPTAKGTYRLTFGARDRGGNREFAAVRTTLTVR